MKKPNLKEKFGKKNIIKIIKNICLKCIRLGRKRMWITAVPYGENTVGGPDLDTLT
jgi:hypothetical protein